MAPSHPFSTTTATTTVLLTIFSLLWAAQAQDSDCNGRWIHVRKLPPRFNFDLPSNCSSYMPLSDDLCPFLANQGLGHKTHNRSHSWYRTDPRLLELIFHRRILEYPCLTADPTVANAVFLPYYGGIDAMRYLYGPDYNSSHQHGRDLFNFLQSDNPEIWKRFSGHDHFLVISRTAWDLCQPLPTSPEDQRLWGTSFLMLPEFFNVTVLTLESRAWPWQEQAVPHPTSFHPPSLALLESWILRVRRSPRSTLMLFAGGGGTSSSGAPNIRRSIREECDSYHNSSNIENLLNGRFQNVCEIVDCSNGICEHDPIRYNFASIFPFLIAVSYTHLTLPTKRIV